MHHLRRRALAIAVAALPLVTLTACDESVFGGTVSASSSSGTSSSGSTTTTTTGVGTTGTGGTGTTGTGTGSQNFQTAVSGLATGTTFTWALSYNGAAESNGTISANGTQLLTGPALSSTDTYAFTVSSQPAGQTCTASNATGTGATAASSVVLFNCAATSTPSSLHLPAAPSARRGAVSWTASDGTLVVFGGESVDASGAAHELNDLWRFATGAHTWAPIEVAGAAPPARSYAASAVDGQGNVWIFGGRLTAGAAGRAADDLWMFDANAESWVCESGCGETSAASRPEAREGGSLWVDTTGTLWLSGGAPAGGAGALDLATVWRFDRATHGWRATGASGRGAAE